MKSGSLFTGTAALDMAAAEVLGAEPAWFADLDPAAAALLAHHYPGVPNLGDITEADWDLVALLAPVDLVTGGWPCQPFSLAGKQKGADDDRALWPEVDRCLRALRPRYVLLENVPAVVTAGELGRVADTLAALGYRFAWCCLPAAAVGAPHRRERFFLAAVAQPSSADAGRARPQGPRWSTQNGNNRPDAARRDRSLAPDADRIAVRDQPVSEPGSDGSAIAGQHGADAASDTDGGGRDGRTHLHQPRHTTAERVSPPAVDWAVYTRAIRRWETVLGRPAPAPTVLGARGGRVLNPALPEWMMGLPDGWITAVPGLTRGQQLKLAGNGVVRQQAVEAYRYLLGVLDEDARAIA